MLRPAAVVPKGQIHNQLRQVNDPKILNKVWEVLNRKASYNYFKLANIGEGGSSNPIKPINVNKMPYSDDEVVKRIMAKMTKETKDFLKGLSSEQLNELVKYYLKLKGID